MKLLDIGLWFVEGVPGNPKSRGIPGNPKSREMERMDFFLELSKLLDETVRCVEKNPGS